MAAVPTQGGVYWVGKDGNVWWKVDNETLNMGKAQMMGITPDSFVSELGGAQATRIDDPVNPTVKTPVNNDLVTGGGGSSSQFTDTSAARATTRSSIESIDDILRNKLTQAEKEYLALTGEGGAYATEEAENKGRYDKNVASNEGNREAQQQAALLAAANGGKGLYSVLSSLGALGGTGRLLANRAVSNEANLDIGEANRTFDTNATNLFDAYGALKKEEEQRRLDAKSIWEKTNQAHRYDAASNEQSLWKDMAGLWTQAGNNTEAANAMSRATKLNTTLMNNTRPTGIPEYAKKPLSFQAPALQSYLAGANDMTIKTAGGPSLPINGAIYTSTKKREKDL